MVPTGVRTAVSPLMKPVLIGLYSSDMRSGKSTVASMLTERFFGLTQSFAGPFYGFITEIAAPFLPGGEAEVRQWLSDERKDKALIPGLGVTLRSMLQTIGTNWGRDCVNAQLWTMLAEQKALKALKSYSVIFDDMRFPNEFAMIKRNSGKCIRIHRPGVGSRGDTGIGEGLLDNHDFDFDIYNEHSLADLKKNVWYVADLISGPKQCCHKTVLSRCKGCPYT
jgi:hypothetical protein